MLVGRMQETQMGKRKIETDLAVEIGVVEARS